MPTLEERCKETPEARDQRLEDRTIEMGISLTLSNYIEEMEVYLLQMERRIQKLEAQCESLKCKKREE
ncbi:MAG: hypothetical protein GY729_18730 [Desulfobacteraceae bacterium]|nr:hypothetical protein [Desulfobacteraceae bacterium]